MEKENESVFTEEDLDLSAYMQEYPEDEIAEKNKRFYQNLVQAIYIHEVYIDDMDALKLKNAVEEILVVLSPRERDVLRLRFGTDDGRQRTHREIGELFEQTRDTIRQVELKAIRKLRHPNCSKRLRELIEAEIGKSIYDS